MRMRWYLAALLATVVLATAYAVVHRHVYYYTGTTPQTLDCFTCHVDAKGWNPLDKINAPTYLSPQKLAISSDGKTLYVTAQDADSLLRVDIAQRKITEKIKVGSRPNSVILSRDGKTAYVSNEWADTVSEIDLAASKIKRTLRVGNLPSGLALSPDESELYVANWQSDSISVISLDDGREKVSLAGGGSPNQITASNEMAMLAVTNELSYLDTRREVPVSELTLIATRSNQVIRRIPFRNAHLMGDVICLPKLKLILFPLVRPKNLIPVIHVVRGWTMNNGLGIYDFEHERSFQLSLDEVNRSYADPSGIAVSPDGKWVFVSHSGVDTVSAIETSALKQVIDEASKDRTGNYANRLDLSQRFVRHRIKTGANPKGLVVSPEGNCLYVAERLEDRILAVSLDTFEPSFAIELSAPQRESVIRLGERMFNSASRTFQGQFSCRSCHPRDHVDRLQYDFEPDGLGRNIVDNRSLLGIEKTPPFKWNGKNTSLFMQCGIRFARILTRVDSFSPDELSALVAFIRSLPSPPNPYRASDGSLSPSQARGKEFFERRRTSDGDLIANSNRCNTCHPPPLLTNRMKADVGSASPGDSVKEFDTPHLHNIYNSAPYLHDGKARTLHEIWTVYNGDDRHGITSDMSNRDLNDLIEYLKTL